MTKRTDSNQKKYYAEGANEEDVMIQTHELYAQLRKLGAHNMMWCRAEIAELPKILFENEQLHHIVRGRYEGGFALLVATNNRVLLIDKKPFYLTLEDIRYDMVSDVQFNHRLLDATILLGSMHRTLQFTGYNQAKLRELTRFIQEQVMSYRQQQNTFVQQAVPAPTPATYAPVPTAESLITQPETVAIQQMLTNTGQPVMANPYKMPVIIRRRVSRFY